MSWFKDLFGFAEQSGQRREFLANKDQFELTGTTLTSIANKRQFEAGVFETPSLGELKRDVSITEAKAKMPGNLRIAEIVKDVSLCHIERENQYATIQAASQFNCLEFTSASGTPELGVACYAMDLTQGPACATACAAGTVLRNYFGLDGNGQSKDAQIENLRQWEEHLDNATNNYFRMVGGYTLSNDEKLARLSKRLDANADLREELRNLLRIGVQSDTEVTGSKFGRCPYSGELQLVTQAYCSACSVSYSGGSVENWRAFASLVLEASYEATMYVALRNALRHRGEKGSKKVFLTALGGGVFGNDMSWITAAMERAFERFRGLDLEVYIVSFGQKEKAVRGLLGEWRDDREGICAAGETMFSDDELTCLVCMDILTDPLMLGCNGQHRVCKSHIPELVGQGSKCPACKTVVDMKNCPVDRFMKNLCDRKRRAPSRTAALPQAPQKSQKNGLSSLFVVNMIGKRSQYEVSVGTKVAELKRMIQDKDGLSPEQYRLILAGRVMEDAKKLGDYNLQNLQVLHLVMRHKGGMMVDNNGLLGEWRDDRKKLKLQALRQVLHRRHLLRQT